MKHILIIGATGQIGSELTMELRRRYGNTNVVAGYIQGAEPKGELKESGPSAVVDVTNGEMIESVVKESERLMDILCLSRMQSSEIPLK